LAFPINQEKAFNFFYITSKIRRAKKKINELWSSMDSPAEMIHPGANISARE
jgi:hypothetical protein